MVIEKISIDKLKMAEYNPRKNLKPGDAEYQKLKNSILQFGYVDPIIWNEKTGNVIGGHQRLKVMLELGALELECVVLDLDTCQEKALNVVLNKIGGEWDISLLKDLLTDLENNNFNLELAGFDKLELDTLFEREPYIIEDDNFNEVDAVSAVKDPIIKTGDIWQLGRHRLICGDCASADMWLKLMKDKKADLIVTDPPYNVDYNSIDNFRAESKGKICAHASMANDKLQDNDFYNFLLKFYTNAYNNLKGGGAIYIFHSTSESVNFIQAFRDAGFKLSQILVWVKNQFVMGRNDYQWRHEPIIYGWKTQDGCPHYFTSDRTQSTVFESESYNFDTMKKEDMKNLLKHIYFDLHSTAINADKPHRNAEHPTMKPLDLLAKFIINSSKENQLVIDPFGGSGSTLIAAHQLNRICYTSELSPIYCDVIINRFKTMFPNELVQLEIKTIKTLNNFK